jgi:hypothetical protein
VSTPGYFLENKEVTSGRSGELQDRYALGTTLHCVFAGLSGEKAIRLKSLPPLPETVPSELRKVIAELRHNVPHRRVSAAAAKSVFEGLPGIKRVIDI